MVLQMAVSGDRLQEILLPAPLKYPIPESPEHQKQLGDMRIICNEPVWKVQMTEKGEEEYKTWLGKWVENNENKLLLDKWH